MGTAGLGAVRAGIRGCAAPPGSVLRGEEPGGRVFVSGAALGGGGEGRALLERLPGWGVGGEGSLEAPDAGTAV